MIARKLGNRAASRCGAWLAVLAIVIQSWLPLVDAALHRNAGGPPDGGVTAAAAHDHAATVTKLPPAHASHDCPICEFMAGFGSYVPPTPARVPTSPLANVFAVWPTAPPAMRAADGSAAQPRAPPTLV
jgi:hypothetical protein